VFQTLQPKLLGIVGLLGICAASLAPVGATTFVPSETFRAGTRIACVLDKSVNSTTAKYGDEFELRVVDSSHPALAGAKIIGYVSEVDKPSGLDRAKLTFFLTSIRLSNGTKKPISAYVVNKRVVNYNPVAQQSVRQPMTAPMPNGVVTPGPVAWQMNIGGNGSVSVSNRPSGLLGGTVYAQNAHEPIVVPAGTSVTVELQQPLTIP
jgi:hypothetical protein